MVGLVGYRAGSQLDGVNNGDADILIGYLFGAAGFLVTLGFALIERRAALEAKESCMLDGCQHPRRGTSYCSIHADKARIWGLSS